MPPSPSSPLPPKTVAIIPSAGSGLRMGSRKKNFLPLLGKPVLYHSLLPFEESELIESIIISVAPGDEEFCVKNVIEPYAFRKVKEVVAGGSVRQESVKAAFLKAGGGYGLFIIHDGARPLVTEDIIEKVIKEASIKGAAISAVKVKDTVKEVTGGTVKKTVPREGLWSVQTPQAFRRDVLERAFAVAGKDNFVGTDESSLVERAGFAVSVVEGSYENIKITTEEDLHIAECVLKRRGGGGRGGRGGGLE